MCRFRNVIDTNVVEHVLHVYFGMIDRGATRGALVLHITNFWSSDPDGVTSAFFASSPTPFIDVLFRVVVFACGSQKSLPDRVKVGSSSPSSGT
ncbi:unnamed protein product [Sphagnum balticum]